MARDVTSRSLAVVAMSLMLCASTALARDDAPPRLVQPPRPVEARMPKSADDTKISNITIAPELAAKVGRQVFLNETGGDRDMITAWNTSEDFASVGIGHFIWFPKGLQTRFNESFPAMLAFLRRRGAKPPAWLDQDPAPPLPWADRKSFMRDFDTPRLRELRAFLHDTVGLQAEYLAVRMQAAMPKIIASLASEAERAHVRAQFERVVAASPDLYPLIDYINFKGEGIVASESFPNAKTGEREGWGLKHVLLHMQGTSTERAAVLGEFADGARAMLLRRIANNPPDRRWQAGWMARVETYRRPLR